MTHVLAPLDYRIPKWNHDDLSYRHCPLCNTADSTAGFLRPDKLTVRGCEKCHTFYISPAPSNKQLSAFYSNYDTNHRRAPNISLEDLVNSYSRLDPFTDLRVRELSSLMQFKNADILDVGFGRPLLLYFFMMLGAIPYGLDVDPNAIKYAKALGIKNVRQGNLFELDDKINYDLIIMSDLIEHLLDPMQVLQKATSLLRQNGLLLIWTPNGDMISRQDNPLALRVDLEHMQYLTMDSCQFISNEIGLRIVHLESLGYPYLEGIDKPLSNNINTTNVIRRTIKQIPGFSVLNRVRRRLISSDVPDERTGAYHLFVIFEKPG